MFDSREIPLQVDVPVRRQVILGRDMTVAGMDITAESTPPHDNPFGFENTGSLAAGALYLRGAFSEADLVTRGMHLGLCDDASDVALSGGVSQDHLLRLLADSDAPAAAERGYSLEDLAQNIEAGSNVIAFVNAAELWDRADEPSAIEANHAVLMESVVRDAGSEEIAGFFIRDPSSPTATFVDAAKATRMWLEAGGWQIVSSPLSGRL